MKSRTFPTQNAISRDYGGGGNRTRATFPTDKARPWHRGALLFLAIVALAAAPLFNRTLGQVAVGVLFALMLWTALRVRRKPGWDAAPKRVGVKGGST